MKVCPFFSQPLSNLNQANSSPSHYPSRIPCHAPPKTPARWHRWWWPISLDGRCTTLGMNWNGYKQRDRHVTNRESRATRLICWRCFFLHFVSLWGMDSGTPHPISFFVAEELATVRVNGLVCLLAVEADLNFRWFSLSNGLLDVWCLFFMDHNQKNGPLLLEKWIDVSNQFYDELCFSSKSSWSKLLPSQVIQDF